ncbi:LOW QUALITY PROTEIN: Cyclin-A2-1 [Drechslerella dactyloides]|uniref:Cyclin-A2-1 n=1 Tax=Drechslerella dactyloides TaxID=74499 RepID=A0AAD6IZN6_DREDA|nr:LOW QUALITY PROTEIN: Cyclin-A2-1 [Drechslerella dactyloides]
MERYRASTHAGHLSREATYAGYIPTMSPSTLPASVCWDSLIQIPWRPDHTASSSIVNDGSGCSFLPGDPAVPPRPQRRAQIGRCSFAWQFLCQHAAHQPQPAGTPRALRRLGWRQIGRDDSLGPAQAGRKVAGRQRGALASSRRTTVDGCRWLAVAISSGVEMCGGAVVMSKAGGRHRLGVNTPFGLPDPAFCLGAATQHLPQRYLHVDASYTSSPPHSPHISSYLHPFPTCFNIIARRHLPFDIQPPSTSPRLASSSPSSSPLLFFPSCGSHLQCFGFSLQGIALESQNPPPHRGPRSHIPTLGEHHLNLANRHCRSTDRFLRIHGCFPIDENLSLSRPLARHGSLAPSVISKRVTYPFPPCPNFPPSTMDAKPQRKTSRIRDENDPSQLRAAAVGRRKVMASTAGPKAAAGPSQRLEQPAKRVALADSTRYDAAIANKVPDQAAKGGLSKPPVRGKPLAAKTSAASLATGAKAPHQPLGHRSDAPAPASKPLVFRDDGANEVQVFASNGVSQSGLGNASRLQGPRKRPFVYRDDPVLDQVQQAVVRQDCASVVEPQLKSVATLEVIPDVLSGHASPLSTTTTAIDDDNETPHISQLPSPESFDPRLDDEPAFSNRGVSARIPAPAANRPSVQPTETEEEFRARLVQMERERVEREIREGKRVVSAATHFPVPPLSYLPPGAGPTAEEEYQARCERLVQMEQERYEREMRDRKMAASQVASQATNQVAVHVATHAGEENSHARQRVEAAFSEDTLDITQAAPSQVRIFPEWNDESRKEVERAHWQFEDSDRRDPYIFDDPNYVSEYADEIIDYVGSLDIHYLPDAHYMEGQPNLNWEMRETLIDWIIEVHSRFQFVAETLYNAVNIIDRFLSRKTVPVDKLQLVGIVALFIAAKYEEIEQPALDSLVYMVDNAYNREEMKSCEAYMLRVLNWEINAPGPMNFLRHISIADDLQWDIRALAKYFIEATLMDQRFVGTPMNYVVAACYYLARIMLNEGDWETKHIHYSGYTAAQLGPSVQILVETMGDPKSHHPAVYNKYADKRFKRVATFVERWMGVQFPHTNRPASQGEDSNQTKTKKKGSKKGAKKERDQERLPRQQTYDEALACGLPDLDVTGGMQEDLAYQQGNGDLPDQMALY